MKRLLPCALVGLCLFVLPACGDAATEGDSSGSQGVALPDVQELPDVSPADVSAVDALQELPSEDAGIPEDAKEGEFGAACAGNEDCYSGWCVEGPKGYLCTKLCTEECPTGFDCKSVASGASDVAFLCVPQVKKVCFPCTEDFQCAGGACLQIDGQGQCGYGCKVDPDCPEAFVCAADPEGAKTGLFCQPKSGSCSCIPALEGTQRTCSFTNDEGACYGVETCDAAIGWVGCNAKPAEVEACDGVDNDCNGLVDEDLPVEQSCEIGGGELGTCPGVDVCLGPQGWVCQGNTPEAETCDYQDNNCDGQVDEPFTTDGVYLHFDHCGSCNLSCAIGFPNAESTECVMLGEQPQCVVAACAPGFVKANDFQCLPNIASICQPCSSDANCLGVDAACVALDGGSFCGQACATNDECPDAYACTDVGLAASQCVPASGSCTCDGTNTDLSRACAVTYTPPDPTQPATTCNGFEQCTSDGWAPCALPEEACDGLDNNCDGSIDEGFKNGQGTYDLVEHCGGCFFSCLALAVPNADAVCDTSVGAPQCGYQCKAGSFDVNGLSADGCECTPLSDVDWPGDGLDVNCDGIDGEVVGGVFVAKDGSDDNPGTLQAPLLTLTAGLLLAQQEGRRDVYVATGVYSESLLLLDGVGLYGGYSSDFSKKNVLTFETAILGKAPTLSSPAAVNAQGLGGPDAPTPTVLDGFSVFGANAANVAGANSYAIYIANCGPNLLIRDNTVFGGAGGNGAQGQEGSDGLDGVHGAVGQDAYDVPWPFFGNRTCFGADELVGGQGGQLVCGDGTSVSGGTGGRSACPSYGSSPSGLENGQPGKGPSGTLGGLSGWDGRVTTSSQCSLCNMPAGQNPMSAALGQAAAGGAWGQAGAGCTDASGGIIGNHWTAQAGSTGVLGVHGAGGGGGGAGGGVEVTGSFCAADGGHDVGGSGGGGGSGGCAGTGGVGGTGGGGSFGIFVVYSLPPQALVQIVDNHVQPGSGGMGGSGGPSGAGGVGGAGDAGGASGEGATSTFCARNGASGGAGGQGGHGGGGGGGCGGSAYGIYLFQAGGTIPMASLLNENTFSAGGTGGPGGPGGASLGLSGTSGVNGQSAPTNF